MEIITSIGLITVLTMFLYGVVLTISDCDVMLWFYSKFRCNLTTLSNKVVWITGSSSGIGEHLAVELAKYHAKLVLSGRNINELERVRDRCKSVGLPDDYVFLLPFDVTDFNLHEELLLRVIQHFGRLDILVNNAGRSQRAAWEDIELEVDRQMFDLNVFAVVSLSRLAVKYFNRVSSGGQLVVMSSVAGVFGPPYSATYGGTKHAIHGYFSTFRNEKAGSPISTTLICPGPVVSNILSRSFTAKKNEDYGHEMEANKMRLSAERCAHLSAVAIANKLEEVWMGMFPVVPLTYILHYYPTIASIIIKFIGPEGIQKMRDNRILDRK